MEAIEAHTACDGAQAEDDGDAEGQSRAPFDQLASPQVAGEHAGAPGDMGDADDPALFAVSGRELEDARHGGGQGPGGGGGHDAEDVETEEGVGREGEAEGAEGDAGRGDEDGTPPADAVAEAAGEDLEGGGDCEADGGIGGCRCVGAGDAVDEERHEEGDDAPVAGGEVADAEEEADFPAAQEAEVSGKRTGRGAGAFAAAWEAGEEKQGADDETGGGDAGDRTQRAISQGIRDRTCKEVARGGAQGAAYEVAGGGLAKHGWSDGAQEITLPAGAAETEGDAQADAERCEDKRIAGEEDGACKRRTEDAEDEHALDAEPVAERAGGHGADPPEEEEERFQKAGEKGRAEEFLIHVDLQE